MTAEEILKAKGCAVGSFDYKAFNAVVTKFFLEKNGHILDIHSCKFDFCTERVKHLGFIEDIDGKYREMGEKNSRMLGKASHVLIMDKKYKGATILDVLADLYGEGAADVYPIYRMLYLCQIKFSIVINCTVYDQVIKALKKDGFKIGKNKDRQWVYLP
jgi:hypothetical protein